MLKGVRKIRMPKNIRKQKDYRKQKSIRNKGSPKGIRKCRKGLVIELPKDFRN